MVKKQGKKYLAAAKQVDALKSYSLTEAVPLVQKIKFTKFDETVEVHLRLGVDPKHADQMVRGTVVLPNGLGKPVKVLVIASGDKIREAEAAGADYFGGEEMVTKIQTENWLAYDSVIATPDMMRSVGKLGKVLGPRGLMPNPKTGTVTTDITKAVTEAKAGKVEFRVDKTGVIHAPVGKVSFSTEKLFQNAASLISAVVRAKPAAAKGKYVRSGTICSTTGTGIPFNVDEYQTYGSASIAPVFAQDTVSDQAGALRRYHELVDQKLAGTATTAGLAELKELAGALYASLPPPSGKDEAMLRLTKDRQLLRESMARMEEILGRIKVSANG